MLSMIFPRPRRRNRGRHRIHPARPGTVLVDRAALFADEPAVAEALLTSLATFTPGEPLYLDVPEINAFIDGHDIIYHNYQDIGIAVSTDRGLMVPIIRNAENMGLAGEAAVQDAFSAQKMADAVETIYDEVLQL